VLEHLKSIPSIRPLHIYNPSGEIFSDLIETTVTSKFVRVFDSSGNPVKKLQLSPVVINHEAEKGNI
jgi:hypothetical protein